MFRWTTSLLHAVPRYNGGVPRTGWRGSRGQFPVIVLIKKYVVGNATGGSGCVELNRLVRASFHESSTHICGRFARVGGTHLRRFASRCKARRTHRPVLSGVGEWPPAARALAVVPV